jgi:hypothetical protein
MSVKASEISDLIKSRIENFKSASEARNVGTVRWARWSSATTRASAKATP